MPDPNVDHAATTLLYVEDEPLTLVDVEAALIDAGYKVVVASDGPEALHLLEDQGAEFRGVITDINLGKGPDGWEVARRARALNHGVAVLYVSGHGGVEWSEKGVPRSVMVTKPFAAAQIVVAMSGLLTQSDTTLAT